MVFYDQRAVKLAVAAVKLIKTADKARGDLLVQLMKEMTKYNVLAIDCAAKLAPYTHAKLQSTEVKQTVEHRFVARVPSTYKSTDDFMKVVGQEYKESLPDFVPDEIPASQLALAPAKPKQADRKFGRGNMSMFEIERNKKAN